MNRPVPHNPVQLLGSVQLWASVGFLALSFVAGTFWFVVLVTLIALGVGLASILVGLPILLLAMVLWTVAARTERWRVEAFLGVPLPSPYRPLQAHPLGERLRLFVTDPAVWRDLIYLLLLFPIGVVELFLVSLGTLVPLGMITAPLRLPWVPSPDEPQRGIDPPGSLDAPEALVIALFGAVLLLVMPYVLVGVARGHALLAQALLGPSQAQLAARVEALSASRSRVLDAGLQERRRIERDLHDGVQPRLTALALDLGMAREKLATDPAAAQALVEKAHQEAKDTLRELRDLVRGISPAILVDRGLDAAVSALAARCPVPVVVDVELEGRLPEPVETAAYFVVAEALTNVARHSNATEARLTVRREAHHLVVEVWDNGGGGANPERGTGLAGLADRVAGVDGRLTVESPAGGPTLVRAELPCES